MGNIYFAQFQAEVREQEREKEEQKRRKKLELGLKSLLKDLNIDYELPWEEVKTKIENEDEYVAFDSDSERIRVYKVSTKLSIIIFCHSFIH